MGELSTILGLLNGQDSEHTIGITSLFTLGITAVFILVTLWLNSRKVNAEVITTVSKAQSEQMESLIEQNAALVKGMDALRAKQAELHDDLDKLRQQNARMYQHILTLEQFVQHYAPRCDTCPNGPGPAPVNPQIPFHFESVVG